MVYDSRERTPLGNMKYPLDDFLKSYEIIKIEDSNFSQIKQKIIYINLEDGLTKEEVRFNIKYLTADIFNSNQLDGIKIFVFSKESQNFLGFNNKYNLAKSDFAPYGEWGKVEEGFAYNLPLEKFNWKIEFEESYFNKKLKVETTEEMTLRLILELNKKKNK